MVSEVAEKPVQQSTTVMGEEVVFFVGAQAAMALFSAMTRLPQSAQLEGAMGMIWATRILIVLLLTRI